MLNQYCSFISIGSHILSYFFPKKFALYALHKSFPVGSVCCECLGHRHTVVAVSLWNWPISPFLGGRWLVNFLLDQSATQRRLCDDSPTNPSDCVIKCVPRFYISNQLDKKRTFNNMQIMQTKTTVPIFNPNISAKSRCSLFPFTFPLPFRVFPACHHECDRCDGRRSNRPESKVGRWLSTVQSPSKIQFQMS